MSDDADYLYALDLQKRLNDGLDEDSQEDDIIETKFESAKAPQKQSKYHLKSDDDYLNCTQNLVHPQWETLDPTPDIFSLFGRFDLKFFQGRLQCVTLEWSKRMYSCAGICYQRRNRFGMDVTIRLSEPLLKLRPRKDLVETMLHEMIHAYCFVLNIREGNGGHGPNFKKIMHAINKVAGTNITVYHSFHDEVDIYKQHWWRCNGVCQDRAPFFGYVKRTCNRAPGPYDQWWKQHHESCGGTFMKIKEPEKPKKQKANDKEKSISKMNNSGSDLRKYFNNSTTDSKPSTTDLDIKIQEVGKKGGTFKGPVKVNGGGTMLLNPKTTAKTTASDGQVTNPISGIAAAFPPTSYPGQSSDPFNVTVPKATNHGRNSRAPPGTNLRNVVGFRDLNTSSSESDNGTAGRAVSGLKTNTSMTGQGYTMSGSTPENRSTSLRGESVDRNHLREVWSKRFADAKPKSQTSDTSIVIDDTPPPIGDAKRRRISIEGDKKSDNENRNDVAFVTNDDNNNARDRKSPLDAWEEIDDDVMLKKVNATVIEITDSDEDADFVAPKPPAARAKIMSSQERQQAIKQEILDDSVNLLDEDIELIDDEYDDEVAAAIIAANELSDTSVIDELFGEDTMMQEFVRENDIVPSGSRYHKNPDNDIITCPICMGKMKRNEFHEHLNGCTGITIKVAPPKVLPKKSDRAPRRPPRQSTKDILRNAGYTEEDLVAITSPSSPEDLETWSSSDSTTPVKESPPNETPRQRRQRSLFKTTRQCPLCGQEIEENQIADHLQECPEKSGRA